MTNAIAYGECAFCRVLFFEHGMRGDAEFDKVDDTLLSKEDAQLRDGISKDGEKVAQYLPLVFVIPSRRQAAQLVKRFEQLVDLRKTIEQRQHAVFVGLFD